jgi:hypothetical protein
MSQTHDPHQREVAHAHAISHAEARHLVLTLAPFGVLDREALARECGHVHWKDGSFDQALAQAIDEGVIEELPGGFYRASPSGS